MTKINEIIEMIYRIKSLTIVIAVSFNGWPLYQMAVSAQAAGIIIRLNTADPIIAPGTIIMSK